MHPLSDSTTFFVPADHPLRAIWSRTDSILLIFAGAAAEFALNKAVDWLYFTGRLPADPIGRLFSTVGYARQIIFADTVTAHAAIDQITRIHQGVEKARGSRIPDWAYRDVLYMLVHYSLATAGVLQRPLRPEEKEAIYQVFLRMGQRMQIPELPLTYQDWQLSYAQHLQNDLACSDFTRDLFLQYRKHLGPWRYRLLLLTQKLVVPGHVRQLLGWKPFSPLQPLMPLYRLTRGTPLEKMLRYCLIPARYRRQAAALEQQHY